MQYNHNVEDLSIKLNTRKDTVVKYLTKYFKENQHYIINKVDKNNHRGGHNKNIYLLSQETYELIDSSYNLKNRYITKIKDVNIVNPFLMTVENSTIGFICDSLENIIDLKRQYKVENYYVDLYIPKYQIVIECDEFGHEYYKNNEEIVREEFIKKELNCKFIRFNPCSPDFQLSKLLHSILKMIIL